VYTHTHTHTLTHTAVVFEFEYSIRVPLEVKGFKVFNRKIIQQHTHQIPNVTMVIRKPDWG